MNTALSIILPCYNPPIDWVVHVVGGLQGFNRNFPDCNYEVIIVNDGSLSPIEPDIELLKTELSVPIHFIHHPVNMGKGKAIRTGVAAAIAPHIIYTDIDFPYTIDSVSNVYKSLLAGSDLAVGVRTSDYNLHIPPSRARISQISKGIFKRIFSLRVSDINAGLKGFSVSARPLLLATTIDRYLFDLEFLSMASLNHLLTITEIPIYLRPDIHMPPLPLSVLVREMSNLIKLLIKVRVKR